MTTSTEWTQERHEAARAACDAATEGPWEVALRPDTHEYSVLAISGEWEDLVPAEFITSITGPGPGEEDAEFIALARSELPAALDEIERLQGLLTNTGVIDKAIVGFLAGHIEVTDEMVWEALAAKMRCELPAGVAPESVDELKAAFPLSNPQTFATMRAALVAALGVRV